MIDVATINAYGQAFTAILGVLGVLAVVLTCLAFACLIVGLINDKKRELNRELAYNRRLEAERLCEPKPQARGIKWTQGNGVMWYGNIPGGVVSMAVRKEHVSLEGCELWSKRTFCDMETAQRWAQARVNEAVEKYVKFSTQPYSGTEQDGQPGN